MDILLRIVDVLSRIDHKFLDMMPISTRRKPLKRARRQLSNGFCLVEKDLISRKLGSILDNDKKWRTPPFFGGVLHFGHAGPRRPSSISENQKKTMFSAKYSEGLEFGYLDAFSEFDDTC